MNIIELSDLCYRWPNKKSLTINIPYFCVKKGEKLFIKGSSGSGKSTLLSLLAGIVSPTSGSINILSQEQSQLSNTQKDKFRADHIGYIFQQFNLIPYLSVIQNVLLPCRFSKRRAAQAGPELESEAKRVLSQLRLPADCINTPVTELSIGQQQRVAAARALIGKPEILIADEPTSALDHDNRTAFIQLLMSECQASGTTLLFVSHDPSLEPLFDRSIHLEQINNLVEVKA
ncbi:MAG: ABC transporter ATP-binding protein [Aliivibrio sp.]|uniref:ABC transporter ATP-binding protein n=1 Tax=Aliivibrio sp. TaxID=1872443 RepID=UPI001A5E50D5|nr:ABC transporter ATP-binding protein [Aliivibrio sp.]